MSQFVSSFSCAGEALYSKARLALSEVKLLGLIRNTSSGAFTLRNAKGIRECTSAGDPRGKRGIELPCICNSYVCMSLSVSLSSLLPPGITLSSTVSLHFHNAWRPPT